MTMVRPRVLVIGASGQVGRMLCSEFQSGYDVVAANHSNVATGHERVDLSEPASIEAAFRTVRPAVVLLAGGMCHVDGCELDPARCRRINVAGTEAVAQQAKASGAIVLFFSTEHVFDGAHEGYREDEPVAPMNVYSRSKVDAENALRAALPDRHLILRTSSVYGYDEHRRNFVVRLLDTLSAGQTLVVPNDQWGSPTYTADLARASRMLVDAGATGTFHATGPDYVSRDVFAYRICERFGLDASLIVPQPASTLRQPAPRPRGVRLDCSKLAAAGVPPFVGMDGGLARLRESMTAAAGAR